MLCVAVEEAHAGMTLAAPVTHPEQPDHELLKNGYVLEDFVLRRVRELGVPSLYVECPGLDDLDKHLAPSLSPARQKIYQQIKQTIVAGQKHTRPAVSYVDYYSATRDLVTTILSHGQHPMYVEHLSRMGSDAVTHTTAVAHLSLVLGIKLEAYLIDQRSRLNVAHAKEVVNLGVAGMLHDIGKLQLSANLQRHTMLNPPLKPDELEQWQGHCQQGYEMIRNGVEPTSAAAVLHHHQHYDGSGFPTAVGQDGKPQHLAKDAIHVFARIVEVADLYDRLATPLNSPVRRSNLEVLHLMRTRYAAWCDAVVLKKLEEVTPPFPPAAIVTLADGAHAVVVDVDSAHPYKPVVKRTGGPNMQLEDVRVDLSKPGAPAITHLGRLAVEKYLPTNTPHS